MPLPRLQRVGLSTHPFLYELAWDESITRRRFDDPTFDRSITLLPGVAEGLCRLAPLVRPLLQRLWAGQVVAYNRLPDGDIDRFLFQRERVGTLQLRRGLLELQGGRCFYTGEALTVATADVDHFLPWSRTPMNAIENLVVAGRRANNNKRDHLAAVEHLAHWRTRNTSHANDLVRARHPAPLGNGTGQHRRRRPRPLPPAAPRPPAVARRARPVRQRRHHDRRHPARLVRTAMPTTRKTTPTSSGSYQGPPLTAPELGQPITARADHAYRSRASAERQAARWNRIWNTTPSPAPTPGSGWESRH